MAVTISVVGGRRAMISAATGAVALVMAPLYREHGFGHLVAAVILTSVFDSAQAGVEPGDRVAFRPFIAPAPFVRTYLAVRPGPASRRLSALLDARRPFVAAEASFLNTPDTATCWGPGSGRTPW